MQAVSESLLGFTEVKHKLGAFCLCILDHVLDLLKPRDREKK